MNVSCTYGMNVSCIYGMNLCDSKIPTKMSDVVPGRLSTVSDLVVVVVIVDVVAAFPAVKFCSTLADNFFGTSSAIFWPLVIR